jgi:cation:H+ antiporter
MELATIAFFLAGLVLLVVGAELLVRGASRLSAAIGISPLVVGLTVVAWGTSAPELAVSVQASFAGQADITVGNVVGSNICNVLFILGAAALVTPLVVAQQLLWLDVPLLIGVSLVTLLMASSGFFGPGEGVLLLAGAVAYTGLVVWLSRRESQSVKQEYADEYTGASLTAGAVLGNLALVAVGLAVLVLGARWLVDSSVTIARLLGMSELVIGLTIVAVGTSMPEAATSVVAGLKGERDIAVGNAIGSCLYNLLLVLGTAAAITPGGVSVALPALRFDLPVMVATAIACLPVFYTGHRISRWEGALFLGYYAAYIAYLVLDATGHSALPAYSSAMLLFVLPLTAVTLLVLAWRARQARGRAAGSAADG